MSKTSVFTTCTPLPPGITREHVIEFYHDHCEMIDLNPLVVDRFKSKAPSHAPADEFHAVWYTIKDKVSYLPGNLATGSVSYTACFHNLPTGLQTHVYAPLGVDIRAKWSVGGSLPGEPKEAIELGLEGVPREGLYLREDVKLKTNLLVHGFVKKTFKDSHGKLVDKLVQKAKRKSVVDGPAPGFYNAGEGRYSSMEASGQQGPASPFQQYQSPSPYHTPPAQGAYPPPPPPKGDGRYSNFPQHPGGQRFSPYEQQQHPQGMTGLQYAQSPPPAELPSETSPGAGRRPDGRQQGFSAELPG